MISNGTAILSLSGNKFQHFIYRIATFLYMKLTLQLIIFTKRMYRESIFNTVRTGEADLCFYITTVQDG